MVLDKNDKSGTPASESDSVGVLTENPLDSCGVWVKNPPEAEPSDKPRFPDDSAPFDDVFEMPDIESPDADIAAADDEPNVEKTASAPEDATDAILKQIVSELSTLRHEINIIKTELEDIKSHDFSSVPTAAVLEPDGIAVEDFSVSLDESLDENLSDEGTADAGAGFFNEGEDEQTIALSGDELQNILTNSEFPEGDAGEPETADTVSVSPADTADLLPEEEDTAGGDESGLPEIEFEGLELDSADLDAIESVEDADAENALPDEIEIPAEIVENDGWRDLDESAEFEEIDDIPIDDIVTVDDDAAEFLAKEPEVASDGQTEPAEPEVASDGQTEPAEPEDAQGGEEELDDTPTEKVFGKQWGPAALQETETPPPQEIPRQPEMPSRPETAPQQKAAAPESGIDTRLIEQIKTVLTYMDKVLDDLPEKKIEEFSQSEYFESYKNLFKELGIVSGETGVV
jgi:hypothetical protein